MTELSELELQDLDWILSTSAFEELPNVNQPLMNDNHTELPSTSKSRFGSVNTSEIDKFIKDQQNQNTLRKTEHDMNLFQQFCHEQGQYAPLESLPAAQLDNLIGNFLSVVKKVDGSQYEPSTIRGFLSSIERHLRNLNYAHTINKNPSFPHTNRAIKAKMAFLKSEGYGNKPNEAEELTDSDIDSLFACGQLGHETPQQIVNLLHLTFSMILGMRGGREQRQLSWGDISLSVDDDGDEYLEHKRERQTKTRTGHDPKNVRKFKPKAWENNDQPDRCPVRAYKIYRDQRPASMNNPEDPFFLSINHVKNRKPDTAWFKPVPMGVNHIYGLVKQMRMECDEIDSGRKITNHSVRKHLMQKCNDMGVPANCAIQISGHKNIASANTYSKLNEKQQKTLSKALSSTTQATSTSIMPTNMPSNVNLPDDEGTLNLCRPSPPAHYSYSQQATSNTQRAVMNSIFHGSTVIHGGTFNFFSKPQESVQSPPRKFRRIIQDSDDDTD